MSDKTVGHQGEHHVPSGCRPEGVRPYRVADTHTHRSRQKPSHRYRVSGVTVSIGANHSAILIQSPVVQRAPDVDVMNKSEVDV